MVGIKESEDVLMLIIAVLKEVDKRPKKVNIFTLTPIVIRFIPKMVKAFNGIKKVPAEFKDLDENERKRLIYLIKTEVSLSSDKVEKVADTILEVIIRFSYVLSIFTSR